MEIGNTVGDGTVVSIFPDLNVLNFNNKYKQRAKIIKKILRKRRKINYVVPE